jgi:hypothetical protein
MEDKMRVVLDGWKTIMRLGPKGFWKRFGSQNENRQIHQFGDPIGEFAVLVLDGLLMFLKRKFPKINANRRIFTSIRTGQQPTSR